MLTLYMLVEGKQMSGKLEEMIQSDIYNPVRRNIHTSYVLILCVVPCRTDSENEPV